MRGYAYVALGMMVTGVCSGALLTDDAGPGPVEAGSSLIPIDASRDSERLISGSSTGADPIALDLLASVLDEDPDGPTTLQIFLGEPIPMLGPAMVPSGTILGGFALRAAAAPAGPLSVLGIPEPRSMWLAGAGLLLLVRRRRR